MEETMMTDASDSVRELYDIYIERIGRIPEELGDDDSFGGFFREACAYITRVIHVAGLAKTGALKDLPLEDKRRILGELYSNVTESYTASFLNPDVATSKLGLKTGQILSAVFAELMSMTAYAYEGDMTSMTMRLSLFLEIYGACMRSLESGEEPNPDTLKQILSDHAYDYTQEMCDHSARCLYDVTDNGVAGRIIGEADLSCTDYLYEYGEYISDNEIKMAEYISRLPEERIRLMAEVFVGGYVKGFEATGKDLSIKEIVEIRYFLGFERVVREAVRIFGGMGLGVSLRRAEPSFIAGRRLDKIGYFSTTANKQFEADHENDRVLYYDRRYMEHRLMCYRNALASLKRETGVFGGPAVIESFGEAPADLVNKPGATAPDDGYNALNAEFSARSVEILNEYVPGEERSFTIIAFPVPAIGADFEKIFDETIDLNTLDYELYRDIQQKLIDTLDKADSVRIIGGNGNETDLKVSLIDLSDPGKQTKFENCVADVNIPVGEVFTSPKLEGTEGLLHVKNVYLNEMPFKDLKIRFKDGMTAEYECGNYETDEENRTYILKYLLHSHKALPMGEFAIGTNTTAYVMTGRYGLEKVMPILIAEKTGPHFAVGDTCYSHEEDVVTYNPDGKAIVARENSVSAKRKEDPTGAYFGCHTDITIPYDELKRLYCVTGAGEETDIIVNGRFVLPGTEKLNEPLDESGRQ